MAESKLRNLGVGKRMPDDPLFKAGDTLCRMFVREGIINIDDEELCHEVVATFPCEVPNCNESFSSMMEFEMHYNCVHRFICSECRKPLPSAHFLDLHVSESHDSFFAAQAERRPMYRCFVEECPVVSQDVSQRRNHCVETHSFPANFRYDQSLKKNKKTNHRDRNKYKQNETETMAVDEVEEKTPNVKKHFTFGHPKQVKSFVKNKPGHAQGNKHDNVDSHSEISTTELMDI